VAQVVKHLPKIGEKIVPSFFFFFGRVDKE
jgi:hypothetical protein